MFHITGCVVQAAADKAKKVADQKQKDLAQVQDDSEEDSDEDSDDDDKPMTGVAEKSKRDEEAREARKIALIEKANELLKKTEEELGRRSTGGGECEGRGEETELKDITSTQYEASCEPEREG